MSDEQKAAVSTPPGDLEFQIVSSIVAKNEREWWAHYEIERLRAELAEAQKDRDLYHAMMQDETLSHDAERLRKAEAELFNAIAIRLADLLEKELKR